MDRLERARELSTAPRRPGRSGRQPPRPAPDQPPHRRRGAVPAGGAGARRSRPRSSTSGPAPPTSRSPSSPPATQASPLERDRDRQPPRGAGRRRGPPGPGSSDLPASSSQMADGRGLPYPDAAFDVGPRLARRSTTSNRPTRSRSCASCGASRGSASSSTTSSGAGSFWIGGVAPHPHDRARAATRDTTDRCRSAGPGHATRLSDLLAAGPASTPVATFVGVRRPPLRDRRRAEPDTLRGVERREVADRRVAGPPGPRPRSGSPGAGATSSSSSAPRPGAGARAASSRRPPRSHALRRLGVDRGATSRASARPVPGDARRDARGDAASD